MIKSTTLIKDIINDDQMSYNTTNEYNNYTTYDDNDDMYNYSRKSTIYPPILPIRIEPVDSFMQVSSSSCCLFRVFRNLWSKLIDILPAIRDILMYNYVLDNVWLFFILYRYGKEINNERS